MMIKDKYRLPYKNLDVITISEPTTEGTTTTTIKLFHHSDTPVKMASVFIVNYELSIPYFISWDNEYLYITFEKPIVDKLPVELHVNWDVS